MKSIFFALISILAIPAMVSAQIGGYDPSRSSSTSVQTTTQTTSQQPAGGGKEQQIKNLLAINGLTPVPCGFGVSKLIFPGLGEVCITSQPGRFESGATYQFDQATNSISRIGAATVNNGSSTGGTVQNSTPQPVVVPVSQTGSSGGTIVPVQSDEAFALSVMQKNGLQVAICVPSTAQFYMNGKLVGCATATSTYPAGKYNISR
jgi:hypothetical protein